MSTRTQPVAPRLFHTRRKEIWGAARRFAERVAPAIVEHEMETKGHALIPADTPIPAPAGCPAHRS